MSEASRTDSTPADTSSQPAGAITANTTPSHRKFWYFSLLNDLAAIPSIAPDAQMVSNAMTKVLAEKVESLSDPENYTWDQRGFASFLASIHRLTEYPTAFDETLLGQDIGGIGDMHLFGLQQVVAQGRGYLTEVGYITEIGPKSANPTTEPLEKAAREVTRRILAAYEAEDPVPASTARPSITDAAVELFVSRFDPILRQVDDTLAKETEKADARGWNLVETQGFCKTLKSQAEQLQEDLRRLEPYHQFLIQKRETGEVGHIPLEKMFVADVLSAEGSVSLFKCEET